MTRNKLSCKLKETLNCKEILFKSLVFNFNTLKQEQCVLNIRIFIQFKLNRDLKFTSSSVENSIRLVITETL